MVAAYSATHGVGFGGGSVWLWMMLVLVVIFGGAYILSRLDD